MTDATAPTTDGHTLRIGVFMIVVAVVQASTNNVSGATLQLPDTSVIAFSNAPGVGPFGISQGFASQLDMDTSFPNGSYLFTINAIHNGTKTPTITRTRTMTPTRTITSTRTITRTATLTPTKTVTNTPTVVRSRTATKTFTATKTVTATRTFTTTRTPSRTVSRMRRSEPSMNPILAKPKPPLRSPGSRSDLSEPATVKNASRTICGVMPRALSVTVMVRSASFDASTAN